MKLKYLSLFIFSLIILQLGIYNVQDKTVIEEIEMSEFERIVPKFTENEKKFEKLFYLLDEEMIILKTSLYFKSFVKENLYKVEIEELFLNILKKIPELNQLRYIDNEGNEIVRVQRRNGITYLIQKSRLQNKKHRYYFKDIMESTDNKMWLSNIDANMDNGVIDYPEKKTLRVGISVLVNRHKKGILIANIKMDDFIIDDRIFLERFRASVNNNIYIAF